MPNLRELVDQAKKSERRSAKRNTAKKKRPRGGSGATRQSHSPEKDEKTTAVPSTPVTLADTKEIRWRLFATTLIFGRREDDIPPFNGARAYLYVYGGSEKAAKANASRLIANDSFREVLAEVAEQAWTRQGIDENAVAQAWLGIYHADLTDYYDSDGNISITDIKKLPKPLRQNIRKLTRNVVTTHVKGGTREEETFTVEMVDRLSALNSMARWRGMFAEDQASDLNKVADLIREGQERLRQAARTYNNETGEDT